MSEKPASSSRIIPVSIGLGIVLSLIAIPLSQLGKGSPAESSDDVELRILPVARVEMQKAVVKTDGKPRSASVIYDTVCKTCHEAGVAGAPKTGDKAAWAPRIARGSATLLKTATDGKGAMPARGGAADLTDAELKSAVDFLVGKAK